jgi:hypothetical protein
VTYDEGDADLVVDPVEFDQHVLADAWRPGPRGASHASTLGSWMSARAMGNPLLLAAGELAWFLARVGFELYVAVSDYPLLISAFGTLCRRNREATCSKIESAGKARSFENRVRCRVIGGQGEHVGPVDHTSSSGSRNPR